MEKLSRKNRTRSGQAGFTLVELLVVITIIGLLVGLVSVAVPKAIESGMKAKAKGELTGIVAAVKAYKQEYGRFPGEYGRWPLNETSSDTMFVAGNSEFLLAALSGTNNILVRNPKSVRFLEGASPEGVMIDPWKKNQYLILVDTDESNSVLYNGKTVSVSVLALSFGKDLVQDADPTKGDDVFSTDLK